MLNASRMVTKTLEPIKEVSNHSVKGKETQMVSNSIPSHPRPLAMPYPSSLMIAHSIEFPYVLGICRRYCSTSQPLEEGEYVQENGDIFLLPFKLGQPLQKKFRITFPLWKSRTSMKWWSS